MFGRICAPAHRCRASEPYRREAGVAAAQVIAIAMFSLRLLFVRARAFAGTFVSIARSATNGPAQNLICSCSAKHTALRVRSI